MDQEPAAGDRAWKPSITTKDRILIPAAVIANVFSAIPQ
jgi:hypothetical protein